MQSHECTKKFAAIANCKGKDLHLDQHCFGKRSSGVREDGDQTQAAYYKLEDARHGQSLFHAP